MEYIKYIIVFLINASKQISAPTDTSLYQVSSNDDDTFTKAEADWKIIVVDDGDNSIWKPWQQFQAGLF